MATDHPYRPAPPDVPTVATPSWLRRLRPSLPGRVAWRWVRRVRGGHWVACLEGDPHDCWWSWHRVAWAYDPATCAQQHAGGLRCEDHGPQVPPLRMPAVVWFALMGMAMTVGVGVAMGTRPVWIALSAALCPSSALAGLGARRLVGRARANRAWWSRLGRWVVRHRRSVTVAMVASVTIAVVGACFGSYAVFIALLVWWAVALVLARRLDLAD